MLADNVLAPAAGEQGTPQGVAPRPPRTIVRAATGPPVPRVAAAVAPNGACALVAVATQGDPAPTGGVLVPRGWIHGASLARDGALAFVAAVAGPAQNQGVFVVGGSPAVLRCVARGCGGSGGAGAPGWCGDAAPGGGTFAGLFGGASFAPAVDDDGEVLFLADLVGGPSPRALFLFDGAAAAVHRVAAVGDAAPGGGAFTAIGPGVVASGTVAFAARTGPAGVAADLYWWHAGVLRRLAVAGDPLPGGGAIAALATESIRFVDGTEVPAGPLAALDACGRAAFRAIDARGTACVVVRGDLAAGGPDAVWLRSGDAAPGGGTFAWFEAPLLNGAGDLAVFADVALGGGAATAAWFVGRPGSWRRALGFFDAVDGGQCLGLAVSRAQFAALDERGDLSLWCDLAATGGEERIIECRADGSLRVLVRQGDPSPLGGTLDVLSAWPARSAVGMTVASARLRGGSATDAHFVAVGCEPGLAVRPCASRGGRVRVVDRGPPGGWYVLACSPVAAPQPLPPWGMLEIGPDPIWLLASGPYPGPAAPAAADLPVPADPALAGASFYFQALALGAPEDHLTARAATRVQ